MDAKIINSFIGATVNTLSTVASTNAKIHKPNRKKDQLSHIPNTPIISVPITTDHGEITIEVSLKG